MTTSSRPAKLVAIVSLILSVIFFVITILIGRWSGFISIYSAGFVSLGCGVSLAGFAYPVPSAQPCRAGKARYDHFAGEHRTDKIFQQKSEQSQLFAVAQKRLAILEKWFLPDFLVSYCGISGGIGLYLLKGVSDSNPESANSRCCARFVWLPSPLSVFCSHVMRQGCQVSRNGNRFGRAAVFCSVGNFVICPGDSPCPGSVQNIHRDKRD